MYENASATQYGVLKSQERQATVGGVERERWARSYTHDALNRVTGQSTTLRSGSSPAVTLTQSQRYDTRSGRLKQSVYPAGSDGRPVSLYHLYNPAGFLVREGFAEDYQSGNPIQSPALRSVLTMDGRGTITQQNYGSRFDQGTEYKDWASHAVYDPSGWLLGLCVNTNGGCSMDVPTTATPQMPLNQRYRYDVYGNLKVQYHRGAWQSPSLQLGEERYSYDPLHRLTVLNRTDAGGAQLPIQYAYDEIGNLRKKSDWSFGEGAYQYPLNSHRLTQVSLSNGSATNPQPDGTATYQYDGNGNVTQRTLARASGSRVLTVGYDIDNLPWKLSVSGVPQREARYSEGPEGRYWQRLTSSAGTRETAYLGKALEREWSAGVVTDRYYLTEGVLLVVKSSGQRTLNYLHQDRLGSPVSISEKLLPATGGLGTAGATLVEHRGFDPYGKALDGGWGTSNLGLVNLSPTQPMNVGVRNQRGFTGHEHLDEFELIHMNGRLYDYNLGRFYGVDPFVQFPANSQSLNPYSYLMNNPLAGTDPTGYLIDTIWDAGNVLYNVGKIGVGLYSGDETMVEEATVDLAVDTVAMLVPGLPAGASRLARAADNAVDVRRASAPADEVAHAVPTDSARKAGGQNGADRATSTGAPSKSGSPDQIGQSSGRDQTTPGERGQVDRSSGCCHCFVAGTQVSTPAGLIPIEDLRIGDLVWSKSEADGTVSAEAVTALHENAVEEIHALTTVAADGQRETIEVTAKHPYWVVGTGWLDSGALKPGMALLSADGGEVRVVELRPLGKVQTTYNLTVANHESYFVGEQRVWVHNCLLKCKTSSLPDGPHSKYEDATQSKRSTPNRDTDVSRKEFEDNLVADGYAMTQAGGGKVRVFEKDGKKYVTRDAVDVSSRNNDTADFSSAGSKEVKLKIRLGVKNP